MLAVKSPAQGSSIMSKPFNWLLPIPPEWARCDTHRETFSGWRSMERVDVNTRKDARRSRYTRHKARASARLQYPDDITHGLAKPAKRPVRSLVDDIVLSMPWPPL
jgi:hypothetical protein